MDVYEGRADVGFVRTDILEGAQNPKGNAAPKRARTQLSNQNLQLSSSHFLSLPLTRGCAVMVMVELYSYSQAWWGVARCS